MLLGDSDVDRDGVVLGVPVIGVAVIPRTDVLHLSGCVGGLSLNGKHLHRWR